MAIVSAMREELHALHEDFQNRTVQRVAGDHFARGEHRRIDLATDIDVVLMRQDPPFDLSYITATTSASSRSGSLW